MPTVRTTDLNQTATYWARQGTDGLGGYAYAAPVTIACRWQNTNDMFRDQQGREVVSAAVVYVDREMAIGDYLYLGTSAAADPKSVSGSEEIRGYNTSPDLSNSEILVKVML